MSALQIEGLCVAYRRRSGDVAALKGVDLRIEPGQKYGLVGESGSGKSTLALAALGYLPGEAVVRSGRVRLFGRDVTGLPPAAMRRLWRERVRYVPQNPLPSLNPSQRIGRQLREALPRQGGDDREEAFALLGSVGMVDPGRVLRSYPHELSGGMQQRVLIAMAFAGRPDLLILDEPTTNLDVTTQAVILDLLRDLVRQRNTAVLYVSHSLAVVAGLCDRVAVLQGGEVVEDDSAEELFTRPRHPYTKTLLDSVTSIEPTGAEGSQQVGGPGGCEAADESFPPLLRTRGLGKSFPAESAMVRLAGRRPRRLVALEGIELAVPRGGTLGIVGESGSGKSTFVRLVVGLTPPTTGAVELQGKVLAPRLEERDRSTLRRLQMVFQSSDEALNPYRTVGETLKRPLMRFGGLGARQAEVRAAELLESVRLPPAYASRLPGELSGGEKQRVAIARAFAVDPEVILFDESVSGLDASVQAVVLDLLEELQRRHRTSYVFVAHDLAVVARLSHRIAVLYRGLLMEEGPRTAVLRPPYHPYTEALLAAVPRIGKAAGEARGHLGGDHPHAAAASRGCPFHDRCPRSLGDLCSNVAPPWQQDQEGRRIRCHLPLDRLRELQTPLFGSAASGAREGADDD